MLNYFFLVVCTFAWLIHIKVTTSTTHNTTFHKRLKYEVCFRRLCAGGG